MSRRSSRQLSFAEQEASPPARARLQQPPLGRFIGLSASAQGPPERSLLNNTVLQVLCDSVLHLPERIWHTAPVTVSTGGGVGQEERRERVMLLEPEVFGEAVAMAMDLRLVCRGVHEGIMPLVRVWWDAWVPCMRRAVQLAGGSWSGEMVWAATPVKLLLTDQVAAQMTQDEQAAYRLYGAGLAARRRTRMSVRRVEWLHEHHMHLLEQGLANERVKATLMEQLRLSVSATARRRRRQPTLADVDVAHTLAHVSKDRELSLHTRNLCTRLFAMYKSTKKSVLDKGVALASLRIRSCVTCALEKLLMD